MHSFSRVETYLGRSRFVLGRRIVAAAFLLMFLIVGGGLWLFTPDYAARYRGEADAGKIQDYIDFYAAGNLVVQGHGGDIYDLDALGPIQRDESGAAPDSPYSMPFSNPPFVALLFAPLALLPLAHAALIIAAAGVIIVAAAAICLLRFLHLKSRVESFCVLLGFVTLWPVIATVALGQLTMLLFLAWLGWVVLQAAGRDRAAGFALALLLIKPTIAVFPIALIVLTRRWRTLEALLVACGVLALVSVAASGPAILLEYPLSLLGRLEGDQFEFGHRQTFYGWNGFFWQIAPYGRPIHALLTGAASLSTLAALVWAFRGTRPANSSAFLHVCSALILTTLLVNPHVLLHDLALIPLALAFTARATSLETGRLGPWPWIAAVEWVLLLAGPAIGVNFMTPLMAGLLVYNVLQALRLNGGATFESHAPRPHETSIQAA